MIDILNIQIQNMMTELANEADKSIHDPMIIYTLLHHSVKIFGLSLDKIKYYENLIENLQAENQRLSQIAKY